MDDSVVVDSSGQASLVAVPEPGRQVTLVVNTSNYNCVYVDGVRVETWVTALGPVYDLMVAGGVTESDITVLEMPPRLYDECFGPDGYPKFLTDLPVGQFGDVSPWKLEAARQAGDVVEARPANCHSGTVPAFDDLPEGHDQAGSSPSSSSDMQKCEAEVAARDNLIHSLFLHVTRRAEQQLTTEQRDLMYDIVDGRRAAEFPDDHTPATRWWRR